MRDRQEIFDIRLISPGLSGGGSERVCLRLANQWAQEGKRVELMLVRDGGAYRAALDFRVTVNVVGKNRIRHALPWLVRQLWRQTEVPVLIFGSDLGLALGLLKRARLVRAPVIYREWSLPEFNVRPSSWWNYRAAIAYLDGAVAQTDFAAASLRRLGVTGIPILCSANPVDFTVVSDNSVMVERNPERLNILTVGRLSREKRFDRLIRALASCQQQGPSLNLKIVGEGNLRAELESLAISLGVAPNISFPGWFNDISAFYRSTDLFVLPSAFEGMPNALLEALLSGCRVLSSGGGGVRELLGKIGLADCYLDDEDFGAGFRQKMAHVLAIPDERWLKARQALRALTDPQVVAKRYFDFCWQVAAQSRQVT
jgi:hypothetical protein